MKYSFKEYFISEAVKEKEFTVSIDNKEYDIVRTEHLRQKRKGDSKPKDFKMSKEKYRLIIEQILKSNLDISEPISVTWVNNDKNNVIALQFKNNKFFIFGAIMNSDKPDEKLYKVAKQKLEVKF